MFLLIKLPVYRTYPPLQAHYGVELSESNIRAIYTAIVSMFVVGGMVGAMGGGYVADRLGRKRGLILSQVIQK